MKQRCKKWIQMPECWLILIVIFGSLARLLGLSSSPMGLHQDEAYSAYNSWAVLNYGIDSFGYTRPVYYTVWGSGMSVLYSYFTMPLFALFGVSAVTVRLPQAIMGCLCIPAIYELVKEMFYSKWMSVFLAFLVAINPWHIQQSRIGIDCNLAVPMLLFTMLFLVRYLNGYRKSLWWAVIFGGLTLYCYALTWLVLPLILVFCLIFFHKKVNFDRNFILAFFVLILMALPLLLFLAVNFDLIPEIRTMFFSVPKLPALRTGEMSMHTWVIKQRILSLVGMLFRQYDDRWYISNAKVGSYYYISTPFILIGFLYHFRVFLQWVFRKRELPVHFLLAIWFGVAFLMGSSIDAVYFHKVNYIHIPIILYGGIGIWWSAEILKRYRKYFFVGILSIYTVCFCYYIYYQATYPVDYESYGNPWVSHMNWYGYEDALACAQLLTEGDISVIALNYANVMLYAEIPPDEFIETVEYSGDPKFMEVACFGRYRIWEGPPASEEEIKKDTVVYVYPYMFESMFQEGGYITVHADDCYGVAYRKEIYGAEE